MSYSIDNSHVSRRPYSAFYPFPPLVTITVLCPRGNTGLEYFQNMVKFTYLVLEEMGPNPGLSYGPRRIKRVSIPKDF